MKRNHHHTTSEQGFTIVELMIASVVLATILLLVTVVIIGIGNLYYKGINQARVQDTTRTISDDVTGHLRLSGQSMATACRPAASPCPAGSIHAYCIDNVRYTYVLNVRLNDAPLGGGLHYTHVLWRDRNPTPGSCYIADVYPDGSSNPNKVDLTLDTPSAGGTELMSPNSELTSFCIGQFTAPTTCNPVNHTPYPVVVSVAYGDYDLLNRNGYNTVCNGGVGDRFCSTSRLRTTAVQRL